MTEQQLLRYMKFHQNMAKVGKSETLKSAYALEARGILVKVGEHQGFPIYHLTDTYLESHKSPLSSLRRILTSKSPANPTGDASTF